MDGELRDDETLIWVGKSDPKVVGSQLIPIAAVVVFVIALQSMGSNGQKIDYSNAGWALILLFIGGLLFVAGPLMKSWFGTQTLHVVTSKRIFTLRHNWYRDIYSVDPSEMYSVQRQDRENGSSTLLIDRGFRPDNEGGWYRHHDKWYGIRDGKTAEAAIAELGSGLN